MQRRPRRVRDPFRPVLRLTWGRSGQKRGRVAEQLAEYRPRDNPEQTARQGPRSSLDAWLRRAGDGSMVGRAAHLVARRASGAGRGNVLRSRRVARRQQPVFGSPPKPVLAGRVGNSPATNQGRSVQVMPSPGLGAGGLPFDAVRHPCPAARDRPRRGDPYRSSSRPLVRPAGPEPYHEAARVPRRAADSSSGGHDRERARGRGERRR